MQREPLVAGYPEGVERTMKTFFDTLREKDKRRYAAVEAAKFGPGGLAYVSRILGIDPKTIRQGEADLRRVPDVPPDRVRRPGGGRKKKIDQTPEIVEDFQKVLHEHTAGSPVEPGVVWTDLTAADVAQKITELGKPVSVHIVDQLFELFDFSRRKAQKSLPMKESKDRDQQFGIISRLSGEYQDCGLPVLSIDTKKRELIGNFYRQGVLLTREVIETFDHDFPSFASGVVIPHGIYDERLNRGYLHLGTSHDTSEFACDCLLDWWQRFGQYLYPQAKGVLIKCDGGGSNSASTYLFKEGLQRVADKTGLEVRVAHYPPYCSKYNPIEHRLFCHVNRACQGVVFSSVELVKTLMQKARTRTGLSVVVDILRQTYLIGKKVTDEVKQAFNLIRDDILPKFNYRVLPHAAAQK